jgi:O-antigen/teichoic acid export membrane protein
MEGQEEQLQRLYGISVRYLLIVMLPGILFLVVFGADLLSLWMGPQFASQTSLVLQILGFGVLLNCMANIPYNAVQALGRPDITGKFHLLELPLYVALCVILIPRWGIVGAALANSLRISLDSALLFWAAQRYCHCSIGSLWNKTIPRVVGLSGTLGVSLVVIRMAVTSSWSRLGMGVLAVAIYFVGVWLLLVDQGDKPRIGQAVRLLIGQPAS